MVNDYQMYVDAARVATYWESPHDMLDNGIVIHHAGGDNTGKGSAIINSVRAKARLRGLQIRATWLDNFTVKIVWY